MWPCFPADDGLAACAVNTALTIRKRDAFESGVLQVLGLGFSVKLPGNHVQWVRPIAGGRKLPTWAFSAARQLKTGSNRPPFTRANVREQR